MCGVSYLSRNRQKTHRKGTFFFFEIVIRVGHPKYFFGLFSFLLELNDITQQNKRAREDGRARAREERNYAHAEKKEKCSVGTRRKRPRRRTPLPLLLFSHLRRGKTTTRLLTNPPRRRMVGTRGVRRRRQQRQRHQRQSRERIKTMERKRRLRAMTTTTTTPINRSNRCSSTRKTL